MMTPIRADWTLIRKTVVFAVLLILFVIGFAATMLIRAARQLRQWRKLRTLLKDWIEEQERREAT